MAVEIGSKLGPYEVLSRLGAGGMGEVYRARDPRLGRDVAIKLLPDAFADDPERLARFEREAKLLASLQHANIAVLHGLEEADGRRFLVMQCVEGESLAQRLARGALPVSEALEIAGAVAAALEAAHESGIVHRDLKPGNVMVTPAGDVKVLDFGLAKGNSAAFGSASDPGLSASPTQTYAATNAGVILGTAAYMSPEQARGKAVDRRTDIWSFGCLLYELLTGRQAFAGETVSDIVSHILQTEPDWKLLPSATPAPVRGLIARCLQKDARRRLRDIGDARVEIEDLIAGRTNTGGAPVAGTAAPAAPRRPWLVPALAALVAIAAAASWFAARAFLPAPGGGSVVRFTVPGPEGHIVVGDGIAAQLSPDGQSIAMIANDSAGVSHVWVRRMDAIVPRVLPGTDRTTLFFWSPDSRAVAFFANDKQLSRVSVDGGDPELVCEVKTARGGSWGKDGTILLAPYSAAAIYRVPARGGDLVPVVRPDSAHGETGLRFPQFLPDGKHFLYASLPPDSIGQVRVCVGSLDGGAPSTLMHAETEPVYAEPGWLVYTRRNELVAQRFDAGSLKLAGDALPIGDIATNSQFSSAPIVSVARTGALAFVSNEPSPAQLAWFDLQGQRVSAPAVAPGLYVGAAASPDMKRALLTGYDRRRVEYIGLADLERGIVTPLTPPEDFGTFPVWGPDGQRYAYMKDIGNEPIAVRSTQDDSRHEYLGSDPAFKRVDCWSADGRSIVFDRLDPATKWDVWVLPVDGGPAHALVRSGGNDQFAVLSPDGRWLAFQGDDSGTPQVYVLPFGGTGMRYQVSTDGGQFPIWSRDSRRLYFGRAPQANQLMVADLQPGDALAFGRPRLLGKLPADLVSLDTGPVGDRLLALAPSAKAHPQTISIVQNWRAALKPR